jgi:hypothetical protein
MQLNEVATPLTFWRTMSFQNSRRMMGHSQCQIHHRATRPIAMIWLWTLLIVWASELISSLPTPWSTQKEPLNDIFERLGSTMGSPKQFHWIEGLSSSLSSLASFINFLHLHLDEVFLTSYQVHDESLLHEQGWNGMWEWQLLSGECKEPKPSWYHAAEPKFCSCLYTTKVSYVLLSM